MPVMDGIESVRRMRQWECEHRHKKTPIVALSGVSFESDIKKCLEAGFDSHLGKPVDRERLILTLNRWTQDESETKTMEKQNQPVPQRDSYSDGE